MDEARSQVVHAMAVGDGLEIDPSASVNRCLQVRFWTLGNHVLSETIQVRMSRQAICICILNTLLAVALLYGGTMKIRVRVRVRVRVSLLYGGPLKMLLHVSDITACERHHCM